MSSFKPQLAKRYVNFKIIPSSIQKFDHFQDSLCPNCIFPCDLLGSGKSIKILLPNDSVENPL